MAKRQMNWTMCGDFSVFRIHSQKCSKGLDEKMSLPGLPKDSASTSWRFPIAAISHKNVAKGVTFDEIFKVLPWSFQQVFAGRTPCQRHDGKPFDATQCSILQKYVFDLAS